MHLVRLGLLLCCFMSQALHAKPADLWVLTSLEPPFSQQNQRGQFEGYTIDMVNNILAEANMSQQILAAPWERVFKEASTKANVLIFALVRTAERENQFHWITPLTSSTVGVFGLQPDSASVTDLRELNGDRTIGALDGDYRHKVLMQTGNAHVVPLMDWSAGVNQLLDGELGYLFFSSIGLQMTCQRIKRDCSRVVQVFSYQTTQSYIALSASSDVQTVDALRSAAERFKQSEGFTQLTRKWINKYRKDYGLVMHAEQGVVNLWPK